VFNEAITHHGMNIAILNTLGECHYRVGNKEEALTVWSKSLEMNPDQQELKAKVESLRKNP
jgi:predicted negative regulator of RcsB-dependent stress response